MSDTPTRTFAQFLAEAEDGELHADLSNQLRDIVAELTDAAANNGGKAAGLLTLKLGFACDGGVIEVKADYTVKLPKQRRAKSVFWATPENNLTRRNPRQAELPLRDVSAPTRTLAS